MALPVEFIPLVSHAKTPWCGPLFDTAPTMRTVRWGTRHVWLQKYWDPSSHPGHSEPPDLSSCSGRWQKEARLVHCVRL